MLRRGWIIRLSSQQRHGATPTHPIADESCMNGRSADKGVSSIYGSRDAIIVDLRPSHDQRSIHNLSIANSMRDQFIDIQAISRTPDRNRLVTERATIVPVQSASIAILPLTTKSAQLLHIPSTLYPPPSIQPPTSRPTNKNEKILSP